MQHSQYLMCWVAVALCKVAPLSSPITPGCLYQASTVANLISPQGPLVPGMHPLKGSV